MAHKITGVPNKIKLSDEVIGYVQYRDGSIIDTLYKNYLLENLKNISLNIKYIEKKYEAYIGSALKAKELK